MSRLKNIVDAIVAESSGVQARLLVARIGLKAGVNLSRITPNTPENPELEKRILQAAHQVLGRELQIQEKNGEEAQR
ncbi:MAG: hypothetical protein RH862_16780 [Leptospiraceae bacterium]